MTFVYQVLSGVMVAMVTATVIRTRSTGARVAGGLVLVPLLLRLFLVK